MARRSLISRGLGRLRRMAWGYLLVHFPHVALFILPAWKRRVHFYLLQPLVRAGVLRTPYDRWLKKEARPAQPSEQRDAQHAGFALTPRISLVMPVYNVKAQWLRAALDSVLRQTYGQWELCIADDCSTQPGVRELLTEIASRDERIRVIFLPQNLGIAGASNAALSLASGEFVGLLDNDDELAPQALAAVVRAINDHPEAECFYSDEDKISEQGRRYEPFFKPDWAPDTLRSYNYLCHFTVIKRQLLTELGGFRPGFEGSQDYDLFLRVSEKARQIIHIPQILYHWRAVQGSVGRRGEAKMYAYDSGIKALEEHFQRRGVAARVTPGLFLGSYRIHYPLQGTPEVAIIIPTKDKVEVLRRCLDSIRAHTTYPHYRILLVDNNSVEAATFAYYEELRADERIELLRYEQPFNFSALNNFAVARTSAEYLLFLNNDTEVITPGWLEELLGHGQRPEIGAVGCLLSYGNNTVQHGGIILGIGGVAGHGHKYFLRNDYGSMGRLKVVQNLSGVTAACLLLRKEVFTEIGGFDEELSHAFNDVDLCLQIRARGYLIVYTPFAELYHHESLSRGYENSPAKKERFNKEIAYIEKKWSAVLRDGDPYYNPNLTLEREDFSLRL